jgi:hypothetical protein
MWQHIYAISIIGFLDLVHNADYELLEITTFQKLDLFPSSGEGGEIPTSLGPLERLNLNYWSPVIEVRPF